MRQMPTNKIIVPPTQSVSECDLCVRRKNIMCTPLIFTLISFSILSFVLQKKNMCNENASLSLCIIFSVVYEGEIRIRTFLDLEKKNV
jgi:hypothetical protein